MVSVRRKRKAGSNYYYLYYDSKRGGTRRQYEEYLGRAIPPDVKDRERNFMLRVLRKEWEPKLEIIRDSFASWRASMPQTVLEKRLGAFAVRFTYNTQRIEGSTLSLKDTMLLLEDGIAPTRPAVDVREAEAHRTVFFDAIREECMSMDLVMGWHRRLFEGTKEDIVGKIRDYNVRVSQSKFTPPQHQAVGGLIKDFFEWYNADKGVLNPVELAALVHLKFVTIHPFGDGNGRMSRLMMNHVLYRSDYPMMDIEYRNRRSYYNALERSQTREDDLPFLRWFVTRYLRAHAGYW